MTDMTLVLKLIADARSAIDGLQKTAAGVRDTGAAAKDAGANLAGLDAALAAVGEDGATVLGPPAIALQDLGISAQGAQGDVTLLGTDVAAIGDDGATNLAPLRQGLLLVGDEAVIAGTDVTGLGTALTTLGTDGGAAFNILSAKLSEAVREIDLLKARLAGLQPGLGPKLRDDVEGVGRASRSSAGQVANLTAQFNDIGMMMASGQNPLMTAIQQGSQVGQVIGPMGAAGAVKALGAGFMAMLSPLNLGVMAAIAFGSVLVQWLVSGGEKVKSLDDAVGDLKSSVTALQTAAHRSLADLQKDFGDVTPEVKHLNDELADLAAVQGIIAATEAMKALKAETRATWWEWSNTNFGLNADKVKISQTLEVPLSVPGTVQYRGVTPAKDNPDIQKFQDAVAAAEAAATRNIDVQLAAFGNLRAIFIDLTGGIGGMTKAQAEFLAKVDETEAALRRQKAVQSPGLTPQAGRAEAGYAPTPEDAKASADLLAARQKATALTQQEVAQNQLAAALQHQIAVFGADSARAAYARLSAERDAYAVLLNQRGVSGTLADNAMVAWDAANGIAESSMAATIEAARAASDGLAAWLEDGKTAADGISVAGMAGNIIKALGPAAELAKRLWDAATAAAAATSSAPPALRGPAGMGDASTAYTGATPAQIAAGYAVYGQSRRAAAWTPVPGSTTDASGGAGGGSNPLADLQAQAREAMVQLDQSIAAINEKVAAGLTSTADAADGIVTAKAQAADALATLIAQLDDMGPAGQKSAAGLRVALQGMAADLKTVGTVGDTIGRSLGEALKAPLADFILGTKSATDAFDAFVANMAQTIAQKLSTKFTDAIISPFVDSVVGSVFPGMTFASGGVPGISDLSGQVLDRPTLFAMPGGGLGQAGEAGREAILPLKDGPHGLSVRAWMGGDEMALGLMRGPDGNLGINLPEWRSPAERAPQAYALGGVPGQVGHFAEGEAMDRIGGLSGSPDGQHGGNVYVNVTNNAQGTEVKQTERLQGNDRFVDVMIDTVRHALADDITGGRGPLPAAIEGIYGAQRMGR